jgi:hypothetical protein
VDFSYVADFVAFGASKITQQIFGAAFDSEHANVGILGAGPDLGGWDSPYPLVIDNLAAQNIINSRAFSMDLRGYQSAKGSVIFGGIDTKKYSGDLIKLPIVPASDSPDGWTRYWARLDGITVKKDGEADIVVYAKPAGGQGQPYLFDSGYTLSALPPAVFNNLVAAFPSAVYHPDEDVYTVDCLAPGEGPTLEFHFNGGVIKVPYYDFLWRLDPSLCVLGAFEDTFPVLGDTFLRSAYVVYDQDNRNIHLGQSADCGSELVAIGEGANAVPSITGQCPVPGEPSPSSSSALPSASSSAILSASSSAAPSSISASASVSSSASVFSSVSSSAPASSASSSAAPSSVYSAISSSAASSVSSASSGSASASSPISGAPVSSSASVSVSSAPVSSSAAASSSVSSSEEICYTEPESSASSAPSSSYIPSSSASIISSPVASVSSSVAISSSGPASSSVPISHPGSSSAPIASSTSSLPISHPGSSSAPIASSTSYTAPSSIYSSGSPVSSSTSLSSSPAWPQSTSTHTLTTTYTITSCAPDKTACHPGHVTTEIVTALTTFCPQTSATYSAHKTWVCKGPGHGCTAGATLTKDLVFTINPAPPHATPVPVPGCDSHPSGPKDGGDGPIWVNPGILPGGIPEPHGKPGWTHTAAPGGGSWPTATPVGGSWPTTLATTAGGSWGHGNGTATGAAKPTSTIVEAGAARVGFASMFGAMVVGTLLVVTGW